MFNTRETIDGKPPLTINSIYYEDSDILKIYFVDQPPTNTLQDMETDIEDIKVKWDNTDRITCISFHNAEKRMAKPIFEEERENLVRICEEEAKEIAKQQYEIVKKYL